MGNDDLSGGDGVDGLFGGPGNDVLDSGAAQGELFGEEGDDTITANDLDNTIHGGPGSDTIYAGAGNDIVHTDDPVVPAPEALEFNPDTGHFYWLTPAAQTWHDAEVYAYAEHGHLVTIDDAAEQAWLVDSFGAHDPWIGYADHNGSGLFTWSTGDEGAYTNWNASSPGTPNGSPQYAHLAASGQWALGSSADTRYGIVESDSIAGPNGNRYLVHSTPMDADAAGSAAEAMGFELANVDDAEVQTWMMETLPSDQAYWVDSTYAVGASGRVRSMKRKAVLAPCRRTAGSGSANQRSAGRCTL